MPAFLSLSSLHLSSLLLLHLSFLLSLAHLPHSPFPSSILISLHALLGPSFCPITNYTINLCKLTLFYFRSFVLLFSALAIPQLSVSLLLPGLFTTLPNLSILYIHELNSIYSPALHIVLFHLSSYLSPSFIKKKLFLPPSFSSPVLHHDFFCCSHPSMRVSHCCSPPHCTFIHPFFHFTSQITL